MPRRAQPPFLLVITGWGGSLVSHPRLCCRRLALYRHSNLQEVEIISVSVRLRSVGCSRAHLTPVSAWRPKLAPGTAGLSAVTHTGRSLVCGRYSAAQAPGPSEPFATSVTLLKRNL